MSLQYVLNNCVQFSIQYRKISTQAMSRSGRLYVAEYPSAQPFRISIKPHDYLSYSEIRNVVQNLDNLDRIYEETISFSNMDPDLTWLVRYQGALTAGQLAGITITSFLGNVFTMSLPVGVNPGTVVFAQGDYIQPNVSRYAYKVQTAVLAPSGTTTIVVSVHRPIIGAVAPSSPLRVGTAITIPVILSANPVTQFNGFVNTGFIAWSGSFDAIENITG